jgi:tetratricopeptide (TPR) repeat protein
LILVAAVQPLAHAADKQQKALQTQAKSLTELGRKAEKQNKLLESRQQYLAAEEVLHTDDAEKGLERIADATSKQVRKLLAEAAHAYATKQYAQAAQILESAAALNASNLDIACNLALTRYQLGIRAEALTILEQCVASVQDKDLQRQTAELYTALGTANQPSVVTPRVKQQLAQLNDVILRESDKGVPAGDDEVETRAAPAPTLCAQLTQLRPALSGDPALLFNLAKCAELDGDFDNAIQFLTAYNRVAPAAADNDETGARMMALRQLVALPDDTGAQVRQRYGSAARNLEARRYDQAIADYQRADAAMPDFAESKRHIATLLLAQGDVDRARPLWQQLLSTDKSEERIVETQRILDGLDADLAQYQSLVGAARQRLQALLKRVLLDGQPVGHPYAAYQLQRANEDIQAALALYPIASEANALQALVCEQVDNFRCVRASFDALRALRRSAFFYGIVGSSRSNAAYGKIELDADTLRFAEISTVKGKKRVPKPVAQAAGDDRLGRLGEAVALQSTEFQGFTVQTSKIKQLRTEVGYLDLTLDDPKAEHRRMAIEPLNLILTVPPGGPGARRYFNNYLDLAVTYGGVQHFKRGKETTTLGEKLQVVATVFDMGLQVAVAALTGGSAGISIAQDLYTAGKQVRASRLQVQRQTTEKRLAIRGVAFKAILTEPANLDFRSGLH